MPVVFTSVINKQRIYQVLERVKEVYENRSRRVPTSELNDTLMPILKLARIHPALGELMKEHFDYLAMVCAQVDKLERQAALLVPGNLMSVDQMTMSESFVDILHGKQLYFIRHI